MTNQAAWPTKQANWAYLSEGLTWAGRLAILARYRLLRRVGVSRETVRTSCKDIAHGVWMSKKGGW